MSTNQQKHIPIQVSRLILTLCSVNSPQCVTVSAKVISMFSWYTVQVARMDKIL